MPPRENSPFCLTVEGPNDKHALIHLLRRHGVDWDASISGLPYVHVAGNDYKVLESLPIGVRTYERFGIIVDADTRPHQRWIQIHDRLIAEGILAPADPDPMGTIVAGRAGRGRIGVWLMPDNREPGILEHFLAKLVPTADPCWAHAEQATATAQTLGAKLPQKDMMKGVIHAWLAWQAEPGLPFGTALTAGILGHDSVEALAFVAWFKRLFLDG